MYLGAYLTLRGKAGDALCANARAKTALNRVAIGKSGVKSAQGYSTVSWVPWKSQWSVSADQRREEECGSDSGILCCALHYPAVDRYGWALRMPQACLSG